MSSALFHPLTFPLLEEKKYYCRYLLPTMYLLMTRVGVGQVRRVLAARDGFTEGTPEDTEAGDCCLSNQLPANFTNRFKSFVPPPPHHFLPG